MIKIICPNCHAEYDVEDSVIGAKVECSECQASFIADGSDVLQTAAAVEVHEQKVAAQITCPKCGNACEVDGEIPVGECLICPYCSHEFSCPGIAQKEVSHPSDIQSASSIHEEDTVNSSGRGTEYEVDQSHTRDETLADISDTNCITKGIGIGHHMTTILLVLGIAIVMIAGILSVIHFLGANHSAAREAEVEESPERKAALLRNQKAAELYRQGIRHYTGDGALKDSNRAFKCFSDASNLGFLQADSRLAWSYFSGEGCERDLTKSFIHASKAEKCSDTEESQRAKLVLGLLYFDEFTAPDGNLSRHNFYTAYEYFSSITEFPYAIYLKGLMEYHGVGTPKNASKAADTFYELASSSWCNDSIKGKATMCLGMLYYNGEGVSKDYKEAWKRLWEGARKAFPDLVKAARTPLTEDDLYVFQEFTGGRKSAFSPYTLKMYRLYHGKGVKKSRSSSSYETLDLLEDALRTMFVPELWKRTGVEYTRENM